MPKNPFLSNPTPSWTQKQATSNPFLNGNGNGNGKINMFLGGPVPGSAVGPGQGSGSAVGPVLPLDVTNEESFPSLTPSADRKTPQAGLNFRLAVQKNIAVPKQGLNSMSKQGLNGTSLNGTSKQGIIRDSMSLNGTSLNGTSLNNMFLNPHAHANAHSQAYSHAYSHAYSDDYPDADTDAYDSAYTKYYND